MAITAKEIVRSVDIVDLPEYYSGKDVNFSDLNGDKLYAIYLKIKENLGDNQANAYVIMVQQLKILTASNFLECLYALEKNNWSNETTYKAILTYTSTDLLLSEDIRKSFLRQVTTPTHTKRYGDENGGVYYAARFMF